MARCYFGADGCSAGAVGQFGHHFGAKLLLTPDLLQLLPCVHGDTHRGHLEVLSCSCTAAGIIWRVRSSEEEKPLALVVPWVPVESPVLRHISRVGCVVPLSRGRAGSGGSGSAGKCLFDCKPR